MYEVSQYWNYSNYFLINTLYTTFGKRDVLLPVVLNKTDADEVWYKSTQVTKGDAALLGFFQQQFLIQQKWHRIPGISI